MIFEKFKEIIDYMLISSQTLNKTHELGIDLLEFTEGYSKTIQLLWKSVLTDEGLDWLEWFLYEKDYIHDGIGRPDMTAYATVYNSLSESEEKVEIAKDLEELYKYLLENNYFKCEKLK
jgi:hypothetical protein